MSWHRCAVFLVVSMGCSSEPAEPKSPAAAAKPVEAKPAAAVPAEASPSTNIEDVYETMMMELADNVVRRTEEAAKHDYATLDEAKAALDEVLPQNSLGQLDAVLREAGIDKRDMATFMRENPELVAKVGKQFEAKLSTAETDLAKLVAKVEALQNPADAAAPAQE